MLADASTKGYADSVSEYCEKYLKFELLDKYRHSYSLNDTEILKNADFKYSRKTFNKLFEIIFQDSLSILDHLYLNKQYFSPILTDSLAIHNDVNGEPVLFTVEAFIDKYNSRVERRYISNKETLFSCISNIIVDDILYCDIKSKGITSDENFVTHKNRFIHADMLYRYLNNSIIIDENEILDYYEQNKNDYYEGEYIHITDYCFTTLYNALEALRKIEKYNLNSIEIIADSSFFSLANYIVNDTISYCSKNYPSSIISELFRIKNCAFFGPEYISKHFHIFIKHYETGNRLKSLDEVRDEIIAHIKKEKYNMIKSEKVMENKKKYTLINNIDYSELYSLLEDR